MRRVILDKDGNIDDYHYQSTYHASYGRHFSIQAKVWCPFCGSKVLVTMYEEEDSWGMPKGVFEVLLSHRDPKHKETLNSSYATIRFPAIPKETERFQLKEAHRRDAKRKTNTQRVKHES